MRILVISSEAWNDYVLANGVLTNWFTGFDAEFAHIYASPVKPLNTICDKYFQITDIEMVKSIIGGEKAGKEIIKPNLNEIEDSKSNARDMGIYRTLKNLSLKFHALVKLLEETIWLTGRYDKKHLKKFIDDFQPDIVFCSHCINLKVMRLEKIVSAMTDAPFVAYTGDNEMAVDVKSPSLLAWFHKRWINKRFKKHSRIYSHYFMHSEEQAEEYRRDYGLATSTIYKCGDFPDKFIPKEARNPIKIVYAGRLYCNRWKSLEQIGLALKEINKDGVKMILEIYTQEQLTPAQAEALTEDKYIYFKGSVTAAQLWEVYRSADIALHVESMDEEYKMVTRYSFSTKIIDLMNSTCAIMAICWERHCGYQYLKQNDAAFCIPSYTDILPTLKKIVDQPELIGEYAEKAYRCGKMNHNQTKIQKSLQDVFNSVMRK